MRFQSHGGTLSHPPCEKPRMCRMSGRKIRKSTFSLLERALLDEDWMHLFDSARPSSHHYHEIQTSSPRSFFVSESSRAWQPLSPPGFDPTLARSKQHRMLSWSKSLQPGEARAKVPQSADVHQTAIGLERQLRGLRRIRGPR